MPKLICLTTPPSASPDCKLAHNYVNYSVVSVRYRRAFCVMHGLRHWNQRFYSLYSNAHLVRVGFGGTRYSKWKRAHALSSMSENTVLRGVWLCLWTPFTSLWVDLFAHEPTAMGSGKMAMFIRQYSENLKLLGGIKCKSFWAGCIQPYTMTSDATRATYSVIH